MTLSASEVNDLKQAPAVEGVAPLFLDRWSSRSFADREVSPVDFKRVFEAARWTASSFNEQPWRFVVGVRPSTTYKKLFDALMPANQIWAGRAPVLILGAAKTTFSHNGSPNRNALYDLGAAAFSLTLQAAALGMTTHQMAGFDSTAARQAIAIPEDYALGAIIALGYQGEPSALSNEQLLANELAPRQRKPLQEFVFDSWGQAAELDGLRPATQSA